MKPAFVRIDDDGLTVAVRLTPKSSRDAIDGAKEDAGGKSHLAARVRAIPEDGKANKALEKLLAKVLGVPKSDVAVTAGHTSRLKTVKIKCGAAAQDDLVNRLAALA